MMGDIADMYMYDDPYPRRSCEAPALVACRHCGKGGLHWEGDYRGYYRLYDKRGNLHSCLEYYNLPWSKGK